MWFLLRVAFWLSLVLILLPSGGSQPVPASQVSAGEAFSAARATVTDVQQFCERQREVCNVGSQAAVTLGQRAQAGAKMIYEFLHERFHANESGSERTTGSVPLRAPKPSQNTLRPGDLSPAWRGPQPAGAGGQPA
jgi:hypothetical protein